MAKNVTLFLFGAVVGVIASASAETPAWMVNLETRSGWTDTTGIIIDSAGNAVTIESTRNLNMPRCAKMDPTELAQAAVHVSWLLKNVTGDKGQSNGHCYDDPRVRVFIQRGDQPLSLGYPLEKTCRDIEPPLALQRLVDQLVKLRERSKACRAVPAK